jgi:hypothetical protein
MYEMTDGKKSLNDAINKSVPYAPVSEDDVRDRLSAREVRDRESDYERPKTMSTTVDDAGVNQVPELSSQKPVGAVTRMSTDAELRPDEIDALRNVEGLIDELGVLVSQFTQATAAARSTTDPESMVSSDSTGDIEIRLGDDGLLSSFRLRGRWRHRLTIENFDGAALEAITSAIGDGVTIYFKNLWQPPSMPGRPSAGSALRTWAPPVGVNPDDVLRKLNLLLDESSRKIDAMEEASSRPAVAVEIRSAKRMVKLTVRDGVVVAVESNKRWLNNADSGQVCEEFTSTFGALNEIIRNVRSVESELDDPSAGDVSATLSELRSMLHGLGFHYGIEE